MHWTTAEGFDLRRIMKYVLFLFYDNTLAHYKYYIVIQFDRSQNNYDRLRGIKKRQNCA